MPKGRKNAKSSAPSQEQRLAENTIVNHVRAQEAAQRKGGISGYVDSEKHRLNAQFWAKAHNKRYKPGK